MMNIRNHLKFFIVFSAIIFSCLILFGLFLALPSPNSPVITYGVSFSQPHAEHLSGDWQKLYLTVLKDLQVKKLRLNASWNLLEPEPGVYNFQDLDFQLDQASQAGSKVTLAVGRKLPRWPECHTPSWAAKLSELDQQKAVLNLITETVNRYKKHPAIERWQLENEPLLDFGNCPPEDRAFLAQEESLLRRLDPTHPILITDSGELNSWLPAAKYGDILGTTMYRTVFSDKTKKLFHYDYIFPSWMYRAKARIVRLLRDKPVLISELQGEPWGEEPFTDMSYEERMTSFSPDRFKQLRDLAIRTQLPEAYWWGVEYWYWEKEVKSNSDHWDFARTLF